MNKFPEAEVLKNSIPVAYKGVVVSLSPRKTPCVANDRRTAGAPSDLNVKYCFAYDSIGESYRVKSVNI